MMIISRKKQLSTISIMTIQNRLLVHNYFTFTEKKYLTFSSALSRCNAQCRSNWLNFKDNWCSTPTGASDVMAAHRLSSSAMSSNDDSVWPAHSLMSKLKIIAC